LLILKIFLSDWARGVKFGRFLNNIKLPSKGDMTHAAKQVNKLQDQYQLSAAEMAAGTPYGITLNSDDCFHLGKEAYDANDVDHAYDWLQEASHRAHDGRSNELDILEYRAAVAYLKVGIVAISLAFSNPLSRFIFTLS